MLSSLISRWPIGCILLLAIGLRLWGIDHDLPHSYFSDEVHFVKRALSFGSGDPNPHWFHKPAFYMYLLFVEYGLQYLIGLGIGWWASVSDFAVLFLENPSSFYLIGRSTTVAFGVAGICAVYWIGEKHFGAHVGLVAALLLSLSYGHVDACRWVKADVPAATIKIWAFYFLLNYLVDSRWKDLALAGALSGMATATKYYGILMLVPLGVAPLLCRSLEGNTTLRWPRRMSHAASAFVAFWSIYFVCSPYNFLDPRGREWTFRPFEQLLERSAELAGVGPPNGAEEVWKFRRGEASAGAGIVDYVGELFTTDGLGPFIATLGILGLLSLLHKSRQPRLVFVGYAVLFALVSAILFPGRALPRHQVPLYPFLAVAGGCLVVQLTSRLGQRKWLAYSAFGAVLCFPLLRIVSHAIELGKEETRNVAKQWVEMNLARHAKLIVDENGPPLLANEVALDRLSNPPAERDGQFTAHYETLLEYQRLAAKRNSAYDLHEIRRPWWRSSFSESGMHILNTEFDRDYGNPLRPVGVDSYDDYVKNGFEYAIVHSAAYGSFMLEGNRLSQRYPAFDQFYRELFQRGELIKKFEPGPKLTGPIVKIYRLTSSDE